MKAALSVPPYSKPAVKPSFRLSLDLTLDLTLNLKSSRWSTEAHCRGPVNGEAGPRASLVGAPRSR